MTLTSPLLLAANDKREEAEVEEVEESRERRNGKPHDAAATAMNIIENDTQ